MRCHQIKAVVDAELSSSNNWKNRKMCARYSNRNIEFSICEAPFSHEFYYAIKIGSNKWNKHNPILRWNNYIFLKLIVGKPSFINMKVLDMIITATRFTSLHQVCKKSAFYRKIYSSKTLKAMTFNFLLIIKSKSTILRSFSRKMKIFR